MTPNPITLGPWGSTGFALNRMTIEGFRHTPIVDMEGRVCGGISRAHFLKHLIDPMTIPRTELAPFRSTGERPPQLEHQPLCHRLIYGDTNIGQGHAGHNRRNNPETVTNAIPEIEQLCALTKMASHSVR